jgi:DNA-binding transcriptional LysR family regulator
MLNETDLSRTDLNLLVLFEAVLREGHVGRAAASLNLSPSAVSHGLGRLRRLLNDPLFLRTPRGVVPTARASELAPSIAAMLAQVRGLIRAAEPFDPSTTERRFRIGISDVVIGVVGHALVARVSQVAPNVGLSMLNVVQSFRRDAETSSWEGVLDRLESGDLDVALIPARDLPARFAATGALGDRLAVMTRAGHAYAREPTLETYCTARHIMVSPTGDAVGVVDAELARLGHARKVVVTVPNFLSALLMVAESDLIAALPGNLSDDLAARLGLVRTPLPFPVPATVLSVVATRAALKDEGVRWLRDLIGNLESLRGSVG